MDRQRWLQIEDLLQQVLDVQPRERDAFLKQVCNGDVTLLSEVEALLKREAVAGSFMESPAVAALPRVEPPAQISHYRIEKRIGAGGMGEVFKGHDETLRRVVALKMLPAEFTSDDERVRRFEQEALAASRLNHPNIVTIFEITHTSDSHFIVEEFIEGKTLRELLRDLVSNKQRPLDLDHALDIAIQIALALKAAHTAWIIHRDIKPENVMVRDDGLVKVLDFGIAKLGDERDDMSSAASQPQESSLTVPGAIMGTASYMSPEQARGEPLDGRTDLFSLGLVIHEMVTGVQPGPDIKVDKAPKQLQRILRRALRGNRDERYASASEFLEDLTKLKRRLESRTARRIALISALSVVVALAVAGIAAFLSVNETWDETVFRDGHTAAARRAVFSPDGKLLVSVGEDHKVIVWDFARRMRLKTLTEHTGPVTTVAFSPDGKWFVTGGQDQTAILWNAADLKEELVWSDQAGPVITATFSPDASLLAYATATVLIIRETKSWDKVREIPGGIGSHGNYVFVDNSRLIVNCGGNVWEVATGHRRSKSHAKWAGNWFALAPDGKRGAAIDPHGYLKTFDFSHQESVLSQHAHHDHGRAIEYSPDGRLIASAAERVLLWDATTATRIAPLEYESIVWSVAFSPDGRWLVSTHGDGSVLIWDVVNRELEANLRQHSGGVRALALSRDGKRLASASEDHSIIIWDAESGRKESVLNVHQTRVGAVAFSPDGTWLVSSDQSGEVIRHEFGRAAPRWTANVLKDLASYCLALSPDQRFIATSFAVYGADTGETVLYDINSAWRGVYSATFTSDGTRLVGVTDKGYVVVLDTRTWQLVAQEKWCNDPIVVMSVSPDGSQIVTGDDGKMIRLGTISPLRQTAVIGQHTARVKAVAFSPDGKQVASAGDDKMVALWDVNRRKLITTIGTHTSPIYVLAFSLDGTRLFTGEHDRSVRQYTRRRSLWGFSLD